MKFPALFVLFLALAAPAGADALLRTAPAATGVNGSTGCYIVNVGKKTLAAIEVRIVNINTGPSSPEVCTDVPPGGTCRESFGGFREAYCEFKVIGGSHRSVRGGLSIEDAAGETVTFIEARK